MYGNIRDWTLVSQIEIILHEQRDEVTEMSRIARRFNQAGEPLCAKLPNDVTTSERLDESTDMNMCNSGCDLFKDQLSIVLKNMLRIILAAAAVNTVSFWVRSMVVVTLTSGCEVVIAMRSLTQ